MKELEWLEEWYSTMCDGTWEEYYGVKIQTIDNPGWLVEIDIIETEYKDRFFKPLCVEKNDKDWLYCKVENGKFEGVGDKSKLSTIIKIFREWIENIGDSSPIS